MECEPPDCKILKREEHPSFTDKNIKTVSNVTCIACLGVLQESFIEKIIDQVRFLVLGTIGITMNVYKRSQIIRRSKIVMQLKLFVGFK